MSRRALWIAIGVAALEAAAALALVITSDHEPPKAATVGLALPAGVSFVAAGLIALRRRPENRTGYYLAAVGFLWFFGALGESNHELLFTLGMLLGDLVFVPFAGLVLAFPSGRLGPRDRLLVRVTAALVVGGSFVWLLFDSTPASDCDGCPDNAMLVYDSARVSGVLEAIFTVLAILVIGVVVAALAVRWRRATRALRRVLSPVYLTGGAALVVLLIANLIAPFSTRASNAVSPAFLVLFAAVPFAFLLGILRSRLARGSVARLVVGIGEGTPLRDAIGEALGDPSLEVVYWLEDGARFVDREGRRVELPPPGSGRTASIVEHDGRRIGALVHDASLDDERELVASVTAAVALALDNERLETELRAQYDFLTTIVDTAPSLLVSIDTTGCIRNLNPATVTASGYADEEEVRGRFFWDVFIDESEREAMQARFHAAAPEFPPAEYENPFTNARGERRVIAWRSAPVHDEAGKVVRIVGGGLDVTHRKLQEEELHASRARIVAAGDDARRRLERNLHDGAQQRLVSLSVALRLAQSKLATDPDAAGEILTSASEELAHALEELRELARGIHPAVLTDRGLNAALESLALRTPLPVELETLDRRLPEPIEAAAYYVVSEALANVVKHARASSVHVRLSAANGTVRIEVADDGVGAANPSEGSGLRGLADRLAALDGRLRLESPESGGTCVVAEIPSEPA